MCGFVGGFSFVLGGLLFGFLLWFCFRVCIFLNLHPKTI